MNNQLTQRDREVIASHTVDGPNERYPNIPAYIFKGRSAFDLHLKLVHLIDEFEQGFTEAEKSNCALLVTIQTTRSNLVSRRHIHLYFYSKEQMVPSGKAYSKAADWLQLLEAEPNNLIGYL